MALPTGDVLCIELETGPGEFCVTLPGGATICASADVEWGDIPSIARGIMAQVNTALTPLTPFFRIFDVVIALFDCVSAIKDAIGPPPQPQKIAECIPNLQQAIAKLLELHPLISIPPTVKSILGVIILFLQGIRSEMVQLIAFFERFAAAQLRAAELGNLDLQLIADCASDQIDVELKNLNDSIAPVGRLLAIINLFLKLAGLDCIQIPLDPIEEVSEAALEPIDRAIVFMTAVRDAIPSIDFVLPALPKSSDPC